MLLQFLKKEKSLVQKLSDNTNTQIMKMFNKTLLFLFLIIGTFYKADEMPPSPPPGGGGGGGGGVGPGGPASPVDMYVYVLLIIGVLLIFSVARALRRNNKAIN